MLTCEASNGRKSLGYLFHRIIIFPVNFFPASGLNSAAFHFSPAVLVAAKRGKIPLRAAWDCPLGASAAGSGRLLPHIPPQRSSVSPWVMRARDPQPASHGTVVSLPSWWLLGPSPRCPCAVRLRHSPAAPAAGALPYSRGFVAPPEKIRPEEPAFFRIQLWVPVAGVCKCTQKRKSLFLQQFLKLWIKPILPFPRCSLNNA